MSSFHHHQLANNIGFRNSGAGKRLSRAMLITCPTSADNHRVRKIDASSAQLFEVVGLLLTNALTTQNAGGSGFPGRVFAIVV
ncbi:MAG: hypothetical protein DME34_02740 [Verrucomicrobia bacterium]|nr:MAG: hypothetical protein DME34_02740 [Verrucomicrobiota bacterium]